MKEELISTETAFWHCMSLVLGLGTLTMPYALKQLGWAGLIVLAFLAVLSAHTAKLLTRCIDYDVSLSKDSKKNGAMNLHGELKSYPDLGQAAFGDRGRQFVNFILYTDLVASSALFLVFIANNLYDLVQTQSQSTWNLLGMYDFDPRIIDKSTWIVLVTISLFPTVHMKLNKLRILSQFGTFIMLMLVAGVLYEAVVMSPEARANNKYDWYKFELSAIGNMVFAFSCHGTLLTIYRQMKKPEEAETLFNKVYIAGYLLKLSVGAIGYYVFAQDVSDQISLNIPSKMLKLVVTLAVTAKKWSTYALPLEPVAVDFAAYQQDLLMNKGKSKDIYHAIANPANTKRDMVIQAQVRSSDFLFRSFLVALTGVLAIFLPYFGLFQALVGALCAGFLVLIFPIAFYMKLFKNRISKRSMVIHGILLLISSVLVVISSYMALEEAFTYASHVELVTRSDELGGYSGAIPVNEIIKDATIELVQESG